MSPAKNPNISGFFATQAVIFLCTETQMKNCRFPFVDRLKLPKSKYPIHKADRNQKSICLVYYPQKKRKQICYRKN